MLWRLNLFGLASAAVYGISLALWSSSTQDRFDHLARSVVDSVWLPKRPKTVEEIGRIWYAFIAVIQTGRHHSG
jgi:hypothetical protein